MTAFPGPTPPYTNPPIHPEYYKPRRFVISNVTLGALTVVTTTLDNDYVVGQLVRLIIPQQSGCRQLNEQTAYVVSIPVPNRVVLELDSSMNVDPFTSSSSPNQPQILAIGDINTGVISDNGVNIQFQSIPGSFINIS